MKSELIAGLIENERVALTDLCRRHRVKRLEVFGSAADGTFDPERSDLDFLVTFHPLPSGSDFDTYFDLLEALEALFERRVDLVDAECLRNPYFVDGVNQSRTVVYDARTEEILG